MTLDVSKSSVVIMAFLNLTLGPAVNDLRTAGLGDRFKKANENSISHSNC